MKEMEIIIDPEFKALIEPLTKVELEGLERDLVRDGCRDALVIWRREDGAAVLLDGHNRLEICQWHNLPYETRVIELSSRADAMLWICENQINRRNLDETQRAMLGAKLATMRQGARTDLSPIGGMSQAQAAKAVNVSERSLQRAHVIRQNGCSALVEASRRGIIPTSVGEAISKLSREEQERIAEQCLKSGDARPAHVAIAALGRHTKRGKRRASNTTAMDGPRFAVVLANLWRFEQGRVPGSPEIIDHYPIVPFDKIKRVRRKLAKQLAPDAVLFLPAPGPRIAETLGLIEDLGFEYIGQMVQTKAEPKFDSFIRYNHELLLIGTMGEDLLPNGAERPSSVTDSEVHEIIDKLYPDQPKLELFGHTDRPGWTLWDNEVGEAIAKDAQNIIPKHTTANTKQSESEVNLD